MGDNVNYIIYDLELNHKYTNKEIDEPKKSKTSPSLPFEIIQIGALKLNEEFEIIDSFNALIKPSVYEIIHPFIEELTGITNDKIAFCDDFSYVFKEFLRFIGPEKSVLVVWGKTDVTELIRNIKFHNLSTASITNRYIDIQEYASKHFKIPKGSKISLKNAVETLNIPIENSFHDAFNDAFYTAEVFKKLSNIIKDIHPKLFIPDTPRNKGKKEIVDTVALFYQFEKIYKRKMTIEEQNIIKLAYMMGKTKQFIK